MSLTVTGIVGGVAAVAGAGASIYGASQAGKGGGGGRSLGELGALPFDLQLAQAQRYADAQFDLNQRQAMLALQLGPMFGQQQRNETQAFARDLLRLYPGFAGAERKQTSKTRTQDLADFRQNAPGWSEVFGQLSPAYSAIDQQVQQGAGTPLLDYLNAQAFLAGPTPIRRELESQALGDLFLRGHLSAQDERTAEQTARAAWSDRGLINSHPAVATEVLSRDAMQRQREAERRAFAQAAWGIGNNEDQLNRQLGLNVQAANEAAAGNFRNFLISGSQAQINPLLQAGMQRTAVHPMSLLGLSGASQAAPTAASVMTTAPSIAQGVQSLTPLYSYGADVFNTNFNASEARAINSANAYSALGGGLMNFGGSLAGAGRSSR